MIAGLSMPVLRPGERILVVSAETREILHSLVSQEAALLQKACDLARQHHVPHEELKRRRHMMTALAGELAR